MRCVIPYFNCLENSPGPTNSLALEWDRLDPSNCPWDDFTIHQICRGGDGFHLLAEMEKRLRVPVAVESDANVAALAEYSLGLGKHQGVESLCMLTLGTGVGNGIILDGKLWHGATGMGGEAGHVIVQDVDSAACGCGGFGSVRFGYCGCQLRGSADRSRQSAGTSSIKSQPRSADGSRYSRGGATGRPECPGHLRPNRTSARSRVSRPDQYS